MAKRDYYEVLGVSKTASDAELKSAFRKKAMDCHPDRHPGDAEAEARFKELNEAYQVLSDGQKRAAYDRMGHAAFEQGGGPGGFGGAQGFGSMSDIFEDLFGDVFGGGRRSGGQNRGADLRYNMEITLDEAFKGKAATIKVPTAITCETCSGTGAKPGTRPKTCQTCKGSPDGLTGEAVAAAKHPFGFEENRHRDEDIAGLDSPAGYGCLRGIVRRQEADNDIGINRAHVARPPARSLHSCRR
jgi:DnaJ-class molecular chaperone